MKKKSFLCQIGNSKGVTVVIVALFLVVFIGFAAIAVDLGYLYIVRGELQNAADSGALAGAKVLYINEGKQINPDADQVALSYVKANYSEKYAVEVDSIQRGHWCYSCIDPNTLKPGVFTPNSSLLPVELWNVTAHDLDVNTNFINAVRVITKRKAVGGSPAAPFFASILGISGPNITAVAVAYIGFAGTLKPGTVDQPIAICLQAIVDESGNYNCSRGRMINSGSTDGHQTGGWTNFDQTPNCVTASTPTVKPLVCGNGNPNPLIPNQGMGTTGGMLQSAYDNLLSCWTDHAQYDSNNDDIPDASLDTDGDGIPDQPWKMTLPVIDCPSNNTGNCSTLLSAVTVNVVWITRTDKNKMVEVPRKMGDWTCATGFTGQQCWNSFVDHFKLHDVLNETPATYEDKTIYFLPDCTPHKPEGTSGGINTGILAEIPILVK